MIRSKSIDGKYVSTDKDKSYLSIDASFIHEKNGKAIHPPCTIHYAPMTDVTSAVGSEKTVQLRNGYIVYENNERSTTAMMSAVVEYRDGIGSSVAPRDPNKKKSYTGVYGINFIQVGLQAIQVEKFVRDAAQSLGAAAPRWTSGEKPVFKKSDEYLWLNAKLTVPQGKTQAVRLMYYYEPSSKPGGKPKPRYVDDYIDLMRDLKSNLCGYATFSFRLKKVGAKDANGKEKLPNRWGFGITLNGFQIVDTTPISAPPISDLTSSVVVGVPVSNAIRNAITTIHSDGDRSDGNTTDHGSDMDSAFEDESDYDYLSDHKESGLRQSRSRGFDPRGRRRDRSHSRGSRGYRDRSGSRDSVASAHAGLRTQATHGSSATHARRDSSVDPVRTSAVPGHNTGIQSGSETRSKVATTQATAVSSTPPKSPGSRDRKTSHSSASGSSSGLQRSPNNARTSGLSHSKSPRVATKTNAKTTKPVAKPKQ